MYQRLRAIHPPPACLETARRDPGLPQILTDSPDGHQMDSIMKHVLRIIPGILLPLFAAGCSDKDTPDPAPDLTGGAVYSGTSLELYYDGEQMPGKTASVTVAKDGSSASIVFNSSFDLSQLTGMGLTGSVPGPGVTPGDAVLTLTPAAKAVDGAYEVAGKGSTDFVTFNYAGRIAKDKMI